jgi:hypothetical protein
MKLPGFFKLLKTTPEIPLPPPSKRSNATADYNWLKTLNSF